VPGEQLEHVGVRERVRRAALAAGGGGGAPQRVEDGLLGGVDRGGEERVEVGARARAIGGEGEEDLAAAVMGDRAGAGEAQACRS
jgi:hypothetical protein